MPCNIRNGGAWKSATVYIRSGGVWKQVVSAWVKVSGVWRQFITSVTPFTISGFSPASNGSSSRPDTGILGISPTVQLANGSGSFTYSWSVIADDTGGSLSNATSATCSFNTAMGAPISSGQTTLRCTVTDTGDGNRQQSADFVRNWFWEY